MHSWAGPGLEGGLPSVVQGGFEGHLRGASGRVPEGFRSPPPPLPLPLPPAPAAATENFRPVRATSPELPQTMRQFAEQARALGQGRQENSGFQTPRGVPESSGFDAEGYPLSPGGTVIRAPPLPPSTNVGAGTLLAGAPSGSQGTFRVPGGSGFLDLGAGSYVGPVERSGIGVISGVGAPRDPGVAPGLHQGVLPQLGGSQGLGGAQRGAGVTELGENVGSTVVRPEEPARYISELPKLSQSDLANSAVVCGNWLAQVRQIMVGLSTSASVWWEGVERPATAAYRRWLVADPLGRLSIDPSTVIGEFDRSLYGRVESRSVSLLLAAVPQSIRDDVVTNRWLSSAAVLFRVLCLFQPGGSSERSHLLSQLVSPSVCVRLLRKL